MPLTQAQQAAGTGTQEDNRVWQRQQGFGASAPKDPLAGVPYGEGAGAAGANYARWRSLPPLPGAPWNPEKTRPTVDPEAAAANDYNSLFGTMTPQARVASGTPYTGPVTTAPLTMDEGKRGRHGVSPPGGGAGPDGGAPPAKPPKSTPEQAGMLNSVYPGWSTGNENVGVPAADVGIGKGVDSNLQNRTSTDPLAVTVSQAAAQAAPLPEAQPIPAPPADYQPAAPAAAPLTADQIKAMHPEVTDAMLASPGVAADLAAGRDPFAAGSMQATTAAAATGTEGSGQEPDSPAKSAAATSSAPKPDKNNWGLNLGAKNKPPKAPLTGIGQLDSSPNGVAAAAAAVQDPYLANLIVALNKIVYGPGGNGISIASLGATGAGSKHYGGLLKKAQEIEKYLNDMGVPYKPYSAYIASVGGNVNGDDSTDPNAPPPTTTPPTDGTTGPGGNGQPAPGEVGGNLDRANIQNYLPAATARVNALMGGGAKDPKYAPFMTAMIYAMAENMAAEANGQNAVNIYGNAIADVKNDPRRAAEGKIIDERLANPDNTPWDTVRNQAIADSKRNAQASADLFSRTAIRRLGSAGANAIPGYTAEQYRKQDNELSGTLGQLEIQKAATQRDAQYRALAASQAYRASTSDADAERARVLAAMEAGNYSVNPNPMSGAGDAWVNSNTFNKAMNQSTGGASGFDQALGIFTGLLGNSSYSAGAGGKGAGSGGAGPSGTGFGAIAAMFPGLLASL